MHLRWPDSRDSGVAAGAARAVPAHGVRHAAGWRLLPLVEAEWGGIPGLSRTRAARCEGKAGFGATRALYAGLLMADAPKRKKKSKRPVYLNGGMMRAHDTPDLTQGRSTGGAQQPRGGRPVASD